MELLFLLFPMNETISSEAPAQCPDCDTVLDPLKREQNGQKKSGS